MTRDARLNALAALDEAIELVRTESLARLLLCAGPALGMTWTLLLLYYLERVEGARGARGACALLLVLLWCARGALLGRFAGHCAGRALARYGADAAHGPLRALLGAALFAGAGLWVWCWLLIPALRVDPWLALGVLPLFALRGALAPSWLAACDAQPEPGALAATRAALRAADRQRLLGVGAELLLLLGSVGLFFNLGGLLAAGISLSQDLLGLDLSFTRAFISPRNHFALLAVTGLALSAFEPLRAALAGVLFAQFRVRREAIGVRALVQRCLQQGAAAKPGVLLALGLALALPPHAGAQPPVAADARPPAQVVEPTQDDCDDVCSEARQRDDALLVTLVSILDRDEFREFPDASWNVDGLGKESRAGWLGRFGRWLQGREPQTAGAQPRQTALPALLSARGALALSLALLTLTALAWLGGLHRATRSTPAARAAPESPAPELSLQSALALQGEPCVLLRALYLASLSGLARRGLLSLSSELTNGHYLSKVRAPQERQQLAELTALFERAQYGGLAPSAPELARGRDLAQALVQGGAGG